MKVLIVGSGGREHAICWKLKAQNPEVELFTAPGNPGTAKLGRNVPIKADALEGIVNLVRFAEAMSIDLTVVGPEVPLALGIVDIFDLWGLKIFGPSKRAAQIEASKLFAKNLMVRQSIPTAKVYGIFPGYDELCVWLSDRKMTSPHFPLVLKADGLAYGKGVQVCHDYEEARQFAEMIFIEQRFGDVGPVMVEEYLTGPEISLLAFTDGERVVPMLSARDYKPAYNGNRGPNTGGMGSYAPVSEITSVNINWIKEYVLAPTIRALSERGTPYKGVLYAGLMLTNEGPKVLEFNCRFGDPEAQPLLALLESNLLELLVACAEGDLKEEPLKWKPGYSVCVVATSKGYPGSYAKGKTIMGVDGFEETDDLVIFQAGTARTEDGTLVTAGGRVLGVTGLGQTLREARVRAYRGIVAVSFSGMRCRNDIGLEEEEDE